MTIPAPPENEEGKGHPTPLPLVKTPEVSRLQRTVSSTILRADEILEALKQKTSRPPKNTK